MEPANLFVFGAAYLAAVMLPGPAVTALVARVLARGTHGAAAYVAGAIAGSLVWFTIAALGLAALATVFSGLFLVIRYAGAAYLLYLAWKLWTAPARPMEGGDIAPEGQGRLFLAGLAVNLGNPKAVVFFLALLPSVVRLEELTLPGFVALATLIVVIVACVFGAYVLAAARARRLFAAPPMARLANRGGAVVMAGAAAAIAAR